MTKKPIQHERQEQIALFAWAEAMTTQYPELALLFSITNSGLHHIHYAVLLNRLGRKKGVPDLCLPVARGGFHGLYVELKPLVPSTVKKEQKAWLKALEMQGYYAVVAKGWVKASELILEYINLPWVRR